MASVYRTRDRSGKRHPAWKFKYRDYAGRWRYGTGRPDKKKTRQHALALEAEHRAVRNGEKEIPPSWLCRRHEPVHDTIGAYPKRGEAQGGRGGRKWAPKHAKQKKGRLEWWVKELGLGFPADIDLARVEEVTRRLPKRLAPKTVDEKVEALRSLCTWAMRRGLLPRNPLAGVAGFSTKPKVPHRAPTEKEVAALLSTCSESHRLWYEVALATGYRLSELRALRVRDIDPFMPRLPLGADYTKNRKDARQPITRELCAKLLDLAERKPEDAPLLGIPTSKADENFVRDIKTARIRHVTDAGKATWHSLRKCYVNAVIRSGADVKTAMELARQSAASLTMEVCASADRSRLCEAAYAAARHIEEVVAAESCCTDVAQQAVGDEENNATPYEDRGLREVDRLAGARYVMRMVRRAAWERLAS